ncbi:hypothetical protein EVAR_91773_1 [Eumeta japonica]|uniref:Uncharacterized protein n=1 Tax=Eumeta variegata TaxID=151549 RepID=A0A4C1SMZ6_EUMVA|nr:hypothetical protein EVAR_91773_1 [Eumeta japonica]
MNDPWDVKSVRQSGLYVSCMKINGTPLLPPVLSQECRKEMQYYKLLALEVEKRIALLNTFIDNSDSSSSVDKLEELAVQHDQNNKDRSLIPNLSTDFDVKIEKVKAIRLDQDVMPISITDEPTKPRTNSIGYDNITSNVNIVNNTETTHSSVSPTLLIDLSVSINDSINQGLREPSVQLNYSWIPFP